MIAEKKKEKSKSVTAFKAYDGSLFLDEKEAENHSNEAIGKELFSFLDKKLKELKELPYGTEISAAVLSEIRLELENY